MEKNIVGIVLVLFIMITIVPLTAKQIPSIQQVEPEGKIIFTARSTGPCVSCWHAGFDKWMLPDSYIEPGKGFFINFGIMQYNNLSDVFTNYLIENTTVEKLWDIKEITLMRVNWQHEEIKHSLCVVCKPLEDTTGTFFTPKAYLIGPPPTFDPRNYSLNCMKYTGFYRNGLKIEKVSGYAIMIGQSVNVTPVGIGISLLQNKGGGELEPFFTSAWYRDGTNINGTIIEKANTFLLNYWRLK
jgi:hypothetical protein